MSDDEALRKPGHTKDIALVVDDVDLNRLLLRELLSDSFTVEEAANGQEALDILKREYERVAIVILDVFMPIMTGHDLLAIIRSTPELEDIPVIMVTSADETEVESLEMGADDFVTKPLNPQTIFQRIKNVIARREIEQVRLENARIREEERANKMFQERAMRDSLTNIYSREAFYVMTEQLLAAHPDESYSIICFDIDRFKMINDLYGRDAGDALLCKIAANLREEVAPIGTFGRMEADRFICCVPSELATEEYLDSKVQLTFEYKNIEINVNLSIGICRVDDEPGLSVAQMCDRAYLAVQSIKGRYFERVACFQDNMRDKLVEEQKIIDEMETALAEGQFTIYLQPQFNHTTGKLVGAEALARWIHPIRGMVSPGVFIPVFENNGFISRLDEYVWEQVCRLLRSELDRGIEPIPISVNISRIDIYNPEMVSVLLGLLERYDLPISLLRLEITESAYVEHSAQLIGVVNELRDHGFFIEMDDFGSGYSSLNTLKDVPFDLLKLDMMFLRGSDDTHRGGRILNSIIRMAKWLEIPVIAEGVETLDQADFLKSVGCELIQGYLYAKPMSTEDYERLLTRTTTTVELPQEYISEQFDPEDFWDHTSPFSIMFERFIGPAIIFDRHNDYLETLRLNERFIRLCGIDRSTSNPFVGNLLDQIPDEAEAKVFLDKLDEVAHDHDEVSLQIRYAPSGDPDEAFWVRMALQMITASSERYIFLATMESLEDRRALEDELASSKAALEEAKASGKSLQWQNERYRLLNAESDLLTFDFDPKTDVFSYSTLGEEGEIIEFTNKNQFSGEMSDGLIDEVSHEAFINEVRKALASPVSAHLDFKANLLDRGYRWYRVRYVSVADAQGEVYRVVGRVVDINDQAAEQELLRQQAKIDSLTGLMNRATAQALIEHCIRSKPAIVLSVLMIIDVDDFKDVNDTYGHLKGDEVLQKVADCIKSHFRGDDIVGRFGGDEFIVYMRAVKSEQAARAKAEEVIRDFHEIDTDGAGHIACSIGLAPLLAEPDDLDSLFAKADQALYCAKELGKNRCFLYGIDSVK